MIKPSKHIWRAEDYHHNSSIQKQAATHLLQDIQLKDDEKILDVGCGDGKITEMLARQVPRGCVIGIDISLEMIDFARNSFPRNLHPNLTFAHEDAQNFNYNNELDIVFSSFALQWLPDPGIFFKCVSMSLNPTGCIAATIPLGISSELEKATNSIVSLPQWAVYFNAFMSKWHFIPAEKYNHLLLQHQFIPSKFNVVSQMTIFPSREDFEKYILQWFTYLNPLPEHLKYIFFKEVIDKYLELRPKTLHDEIEFEFSRLDFIASKASL